MDGHEMPGGSGGTGRGSGGTGRGSGGTGRGSGGTGRGSGGRGSGSKRGRPIAEARVVKPASQGKIPRSFLLANLCRKFSEGFKILLTLLNLY